MHTAIGTFIYTFGLAAILALCAVFAHPESFHILFPVAFLLSLALTAVVGLVWPGSRGRQTPMELRDALIILTFALVLNQFLFGPVAYQVGSSVAEWALPRSYLEAVRTLPLWAALPLALVLSEAAEYIGHRYLHSWTPAWERSHSVHHEPHTFGATLAMRTSFVDYFAIHLTRALVLHLAHFDPSVSATAMVLSVHGSLISHANTSLRFGPLNRLFNTPDVHAWHHDAGLRVNYSGGILIFFDQLAGTYHCPKSGSPRLGTDNIAQLRSAWEAITLRPPHWSEKPGRKVQKVIG
jgi:sterol desaturase/sphingolipid hydroxylase (fatty acid hydroxylase superfamily)